MREYVASTGCLARATHDVEESEGGGIGKQEGAR
jgi:hypothetical protein